MSCSSATVAEPAPPQGDRAPGTAGAPDAVAMLGAGEARLAFRAYPAERPWLHVLISHGFAEHMGWWSHVGEALAAAGVSAYLFDHYHHGRSAGRAGDARDYDHFVEGLLLALAEGVAPHRRAAAGEPPAPLVLLGHSNGALIALHALHRLPPGTLGGLVLSSPLLDLPPWRRYSGAAVVGLLRWVWPGLRVPLRMRPERLTHDRAHWPRYRTDPLRFRFISVGFFAAMQRAMREARARVTRTDVPVLMLRAGAERLVSGAASDTWFERLSAPDKERIVYPGFCHELFNEVEWSRVLADVLDWCRSHVAPEDATPATHPPGGHRDPA